MKHNPNTDSSKMFIYCILYLTNVFYFTEVHRKLKNIQEKMLLFFFSFQSYESKHLLQHQSKSGIPRLLETLPIDRQLERKACCW